MIKIVQQNDGGFLLPTCRGKEIIDTAKLIRIEASSNYSKLFFADGTSLVVAKVLKWFLEKLPNEQFLRSHSKHIINISFINKYSNGKIEMHNMQTIDVSKRKRMGFLKSLYSLG